MSGDSGSLIVLTTPPTTSAASANGVIGSNGINNGISTSSSSASALSSSSSSSQSSTSSPSKENISNNNKEKVLVMDKDNNKESIINNKDKDACNGSMSSGVSSCSEETQGERDASLSSLSPEDNPRVCRDYLRNVCRRVNCRFLHPGNVKPRADPIFCHDFQIGKCFRSSCKFVHCNKDDEEHYLRTGELPRSDNRTGGRQNVVQRPNINGRDGRSGVMSMRNGEAGEDSIPVCKDFLKGICERGPRGCRYRHVLPSVRGVGHQRICSSNPPVYGRPVIVRGRGGMQVMMAPIMSSAPHQSQNRRNYVPSKRPYSHNDIYMEYVHSAPGMQEAKRQRYAPHPSTSMEDEFCYDEDLVDEYDVLDPPPPPPTTSSSQSNGNQGWQQTHNNQGYVALSSPPPGSQGGPPPPPGGPRNGQEVPSPFFQSAPPGAEQSATIKALEDENFMLKRRIEELKSSNEFLLSQNAQLRLNNTLSVGTSVAQVQPLAVSAVQVSAAGPGAAQPSIIGITSSSLSGSQPLPTISISTLPTAVTPVSISQSQIPPQSQPQIFLPAPPN